MLQIYSAKGCPYAQRVRALLQHADVKHELHEIDLANKPKEFLALSPTGRVPMLVDGEVKLYESFVLLQYVSEKHGLKNALADDVGLRARQRLAMIQWDSIVGSAVMKSLKEGKYEPNDGFERELDELTETTRRTGTGPSMLAFQLAPFWLRWGWVGRKHIPALIAFDKRPELVKWLDAAVALPSVQVTQPDKDATVKLFVERFGPQRAS